MIPNAAVRSVRPVTTGVDTDLAMALHEQMVLIRRFETKVDVLYRQGRVRGPAHLGMGQEAIAVGAASVLRPADRSIGTYRGHAHALARGAPPGPVLRELLGREGGICAGKGGSMHITDTEHGYYGSYAIIGAHLPIAAGMAWADQIQGNGNVTLCFFGDGTTNIGAFHEALNLAAVWSLPVVFVCENNQYMEYTSIADVIAVKHPAADRAAAYGLAPIRVDGNDVDAVRAAMDHAVSRARDGGGPSLVEAETYRHGGHSAADPAAYRSADEVAQWKQRDPIVLHAAVLTASGVAEADIAGIGARVDAEIERITADALAAPPPQAETAWTDMWSDGSSSWRN
jgi:TPP-dependent pyruvate/acetoin dehydrogenase alpha subunit